MSDVDWSELRRLPIAASLLGCCWGTTVTTPDDQQRCHARAVRITVVHYGHWERELRLCATHLARLEQETTPR